MIPRSQASAYTLPSPVLPLGLALLVVVLLLYHTTPETRPANGLTPAVTLNRPKALNALCTPLFEELNGALKKLDADRSIGAIVLTGSERAFAAGADIKEMKDLSFADAYGADFITLWSSTLTALAKPTIAAVNGYALGGGCELAMMTDVVYCSRGASFGQPEIKLGTIPGAGGSQRLTRAVGKSRAMELILTGDMFSGAQAAEWGLAARVFETPQECLDGAVGLAARIAGLSRLAVKGAKEVVNKSQELGLREGVEFERRVFHGLFGSRDQKIGKFARSRFCPLTSWGPPYSWLAGEPPPVSCPVSMTNVSGSSQA
jgi:enoyl-CoA hydratase